MHFKVQDPRGVFFHTSLCTVIIIILSSLRSDRIQKIRGKNGLLPVLSKTTWEKALKFDAYEAITFIIIVDDI